MGHSTEDYYSLSQEDYLRINTTCSSVMILCDYQTRLLLSAAVVCWCRESEIKEHENGAFKLREKNFWLYIFWGNGTKRHQADFYCWKEKNTHTALVKLGLSAILKVSLCSFSHCCFVVKSSASLETVDTNWEYRFKRRKWEVPKKNMLNRFCAYELESLTCGF